MRLIHPISEEHGKLLLGRPVCVIKNDGSRHLGILSGIGKGRLVLNGGQENDENGSEEIPTGKTFKKKSKHAKAEIKTVPLPSAAFPPASYRPFGERMTVELSSVACMFPVFL